MPTTPRKPIPGIGLVTPQSGNHPKTNALDISSPFTPSKVSLNGSLRSQASGQNHRETQATSTTATLSDEEFYDWPASDEEELGRAADELSSDHSSTQKGPASVPVTPRKALKPEMLSTPSKRNHDEAFNAEAGPTYPTPISARPTDDDIFTTPATGPRTGKSPFASVRPEPDLAAETPTPIRYKDIPVGHDSELASEILTTLGTYAISLPSDAREAVKAICDRHVMHAKGIMKGRDVSRAMVRAKEERIAELQQTIGGLKGERETDRAVIRHLKRDMERRKGQG